MTARINLEYQENIALITINNPPTRPDSQYNCGKFEFVGTKYSSDVELNIITVAVI